MPPSGLERIFAALEAAGGRYLVVGGVAVVLQLHREAQRRAWLRLSHVERLRWLEQAKRFARLALEAARKRRQRADPASESDQE